MYGIKRVFTTGVQEAVTREDVLALFALPTYGDPSLPFGTQSKSTADSIIHGLNRTSEKIGWQFTAELFVFA